MKRNGHRGCFVALIISAVILIVLYVFIIAFMILISPGWDDWSYELPNEYSINRLNANDILLTYSDNIVIESRIVAFCYNGRFVCIKRFPIEGILNEYYLEYTLSDSDEEVDLEYYIVDTENAKVYGAYNYESYTDMINKFAIPDIGEWKDIREGQYPE